MNTCKRERKFYQHNITYQKRIKNDPLEFPCTGVFPPLYIYINKLSAKLTNASFIYTLTHFNSQQHFHPIQASPSNCTEIGRFATSSFPGICCRITSYHRSCLSHFKVSTVKCKIWLIRRRQRVEWSGE